MRSAACARSIVLVATAGCQRSWPLKSRSTFQTTPVGASRIVLLTMCGTDSASEHALERIEAALKHAGSDRVDQFSLALRRTVEFGRPFQEGLFTVGHRRQTQCRDVVLDAHRRFENRIGAEHVVVGEAEQLFANAVAVAQREIAHATDFVRGFSALDAALGDRRMPVGQAVEVAYPCPDPIVADIDDGRNIDTSHGAPSALLAWARRFSLALGGTGGRSRRPVLALIPWRGLLADTLHIACFANKAWHLRETATLDADVGEDRVDQRRLNAVTQRRIDHFVRCTASAAAVSVAAGQTVDVQDADALDLLHRLDALAHDALDAVEQLAAEQRVARLVGEHVLGLVEQLLRLGFDRRAHPFGLGADPRLLGFLFGDQHFDRLASLGELAVAHGDDTLGRLGRARLGVLGLGMRGRMFERLLIENNRLLHQRRLDFLLAIDLQLAQIPLAPDAGLVEPAVGRDARALDFLVGGNLGFLQGLDARDLQLLDHAPTLQPGSFERLLPRHLGGLDLAAGHDLGLLEQPIGVDALGALRRQRYDPVLVGELDRFLLVDVEHFALLAGGYALGLERKFDADALTLDRVAAVQFGRLDLFCTLDVLFLRLLLAHDAGESDILLLGDPRRLDRLARGNIGFLDRAMARDFERANAFLLGNARGFGRFARRDAGDFECLIAIDLQFAGALLGGDSARSEHTFARDAGGFHRLLRNDLGFLDRADLLDLERAGLLVGGDPFGVNDARLCDPRLLGRLLGGNLGFVNRPGAFNLAPSGILLVGDAGVGDDAVLLDPGLLDEFARLDLGCVDRAGTLDFLLPHLAFRSDASGVDRALVGDAGLFDFLPREDLLGFDHLGALDFPLPGFALGGDARFRDGLFVGDARLFDGLARRDLRLFGFGLAQRAFARHLRALQGAADR